MKKNLVFVFAALALVGLLSACKAQKTTTPIQGNWTVDLTQTLANAKLVGASSRDLEHVRETFSGGQLKIDDKNIKLGFVGASGGETWSYTLGAKDGNCFQLTVNSAPAVYRYCVQNDKLEIHDPATKLVVAYERS